MFNLTATTISLAINSSGLDLTGMVTYGDDSYGVGRYRGHVRQRCSRTHWICAASSGPVNNERGGHRHRTF